MKYYAHDSELTKLKIKAKSLAEEARIIRREEAKELKKSREYMKRQNVKGHTSDTYLSLRDHRARVVRLEARATHLARAFLMRKPYIIVEQNIHDSWDHYMALWRAGQIAFKYMHKGWPTSNDYHPYKEYYAAYEAWKADDIQKALTYPQQSRNILQRNAKRIRVENEIKHEIMISWAEETHSHKSPRTYLK